jgi:hypothetical protein
VNPNSELRLLTALLGSASMARRGPAVRRKDPLTDYR